VRYGPALGSTVVAALVLGVLPARAIELSPALSDMYAMVSMPPPAANRTIVCYSFGCKQRVMLDLTAADRKRLTEILAAGRASPEAERKALAQAVVWFDHRMGPIIGTSKRVARANGINGTQANNFDCFDTTRNTSSLFLILQDWGLLRHHAVGDPRYRGNVLFGQLPHNTAVVVERTSRREWAVDMWTHAFAELPDVMPVEQWQSER
jgi:hypothetical protein